MADKPKKIKEFTNMDIMDDNICCHHSAQGWPSAQLQAMTIQEMTIFKSIVQEEWEI